MIVNGLTYVMRWIFFLIDNIIAFVIRLLYGFIIDIANASIMQEYIFTFMDRIYTFLAIFMVFKLSISMVNYILNPEQFTDKSKGFGKIIQNVIIVIALIIFVPTIFDWAYGLQCMVLNSGVLNTVITGKSSISDDFDIEESCFGDSKQCAASKELKKENAYMLTYSIFSAFVYQGSSDNLVLDMEGDHESAIAGWLGNRTCEEVGNIGSDNPDYIEASRCLFNIGTTTNINNTYLVLLSTICLGFVAYVFIGFVIDISVRSVKLAFLQLIAPIPIISKLDPSSGKSGMFSKWVKECTKTFGDLFIRLGAVYFAIDLIEKVMHGKITMMNGCEPSIWVKLVIALAILSFAKQLPQFIENITGVKMSGDGLSLKKKLANNAGFGAAAGLATGAAIGTIGAATGAGIGRGFMGAWQGMRAGMQGKGMGDIRKGQVDANAKMRKSIADGSTFGGRMGARWSNYLGTPGTFGNIERDEHEIDEKIKAIDNEMAEDKRTIAQRKQLADNIAAQENRAKDKIKAGEAGALSTEYFEREAKIEQLKGQLQSASAQYQRFLNEYNAAQLAGDDSAMASAQANMEQVSGNMDSFRSNIAQAQVDLNDYLNNTAVYDYIENSGDAVIENLVNDYNELTRIQGVDNYDSASDRHSQMGRAKGEISQIETRNRDKESQRSQLENDKKALYEDKRKASADNSAIK